MADDPDGLAEVLGADHVAAFPLLAVACKPVTNSDTLMPHVLISLKGLDGETIEYTCPPDGADTLACRLTEAAMEARARHWE